MLFRPKNNWRVLKVRRLLLVLSLSLQKLSGISSSFSLSLEQLLLSSSHINQRIFRGLISRSSLGRALNNIALSPDLGAWVPGKASCKFNKSHDALIIHRTHTEISLDFFPGCNHATVELNLQSGLLFFGSLFGVPGERTAKTKRGALLSRAPVTSRVGLKVITFHKIKFFFLRLNYHTHMRTC